MAEYRKENKHGVTTCKWRCGCEVYSITDTGKHHGISMCEEHLIYVLGGGDIEVAAERITEVASTVKI